LPFPASIKNPDRDQSGLGAHHSPLLIKCQPEFEEFGLTPFPTPQKIRRSPTMNCQAAVAWCFTSSELKRFRASGEYRVAAADSDRIHSRV